MIKTLKEAVKARDTATNQLQVYKEINNFLSQFISRDGVPTANLIQLENSRESVPELDIELIMNEIEANYIVPLNNKIEELDNLKVQ